MTEKAVGCVLLAALLAVPFVVQSEFWLSFWLLVLMFAFLGQAWNVLGGYAGQFSFGHALFFGGGAFCTAILQVRHGINAYLAGGIAIALTAVVGGLLGYLVFRYRLRGAYFALVTLAFAEVARVLIASFEYTGGGFGVLVPLSRGAANFQFADRRIFYLIAWALVAGGCLIAWWLENSRFGAQLIAVRENEDGAQALGVNLVFVDSHIAFGPAMSIEALLVAIIGGMGTIFGPLFGAVLLHALGEAAKQITGNAPGLNLVLYGLLLIVALRFLPSGFASALGRKPKPAPEAADA
jgi:branched-chain amino acid transport system permease protein